MAIMMNEKKIDKLIEDWHHFVKQINVGASFLDGESIYFMNTFAGDLEKLKNTGE